MSAVRVIRSKNLHATLEVLEKEYALIRRSGMFTKNELSKDMKARINFERQIHQLPTVPLTLLNDFLVHLEGYVKHVSKRFKNSRDTRILQAFLLNILKRMKFLHEKRILCYRNKDRTFLNKYLKFCNDYDMMDKAKTFLVVKYRKNLKIWWAAVNIISKEFQDCRVAVDYLTTALINNKGNRVLYKQMICVELDAAARSSRQAYVDKCFDRLKGALSTLFDEDHSEAYYLKIVQFVHQYTFSGALLQFISRQIMAKFPCSVDVRHKLAQIELQEYEILICNKVQSDTVVSTDPNTKLIACVEKYQDGIEHIDESAKSEMCFIYVDFLRTLCLDVKNKYSQELKCRELNNALTIYGKYISDEKYLSWIGNMDVGDNVALARIALKVHPTSAELYAERLYYESCVEGKRAIRQIFKEGRVALKEHAWLLWRSYLTYICTNGSTHDKVKVVFDKGIKQHPNISNQLKPRYVKFLATTEGLDSARRLYMRIANAPPYCKELHTSMLRLEERAENHDAMEDIYVFATRQFKGDLDIWIEYVKYKVRMFNYYYKEQRTNGHMLELRWCLRDLCERAKTSLPITAIAELVMLCTQLLQ